MEGSPGLGAPSVVVASSRGLITDVSIQALRRGKPEQCSCRSLHQPGQGHGALQTAVFGRGGEESQEAGCHEGVKGVWRTWTWIIRLMGANRTRLLFSEASVHKKRTRFRYENMARQQLPVEKDTRAPDTLQCNAPLVRCSKCE